MMWQDLMIGQCTERNIDYGLIFATTSQMRKSLLILFIIVQSCTQVRSPYYEHIESDELENSDLVPVGYVEMVTEEEVPMATNVQKINKPRLRTNSLSQDNYFGEDEWEDAEEEINVENHYRKSITDTSTIYLNIHGLENKKVIVDLNNILMDAEDLFYDEEYKKAHNKFMFISETATPNLPEKFISEYYLAENLITKNDFDDALIILNKLYLNEIIPEDIKEKTTLRIGQIYCILGQKSKAERYFKEFKNKYKESIYINLSDCNDG